MRSPEQRFWSKVQGGDVGTCWLWTGATAGGGYGDFYVGRVDGRKVYSPAHRWAYEHMVGPIPPGLQLDHVRARGCTSRLCVNPWHLEPVTQPENIRRGQGHGSETQCPQGHPYSPENTYRAARGDRQCRECMRQRNRLASRRRSANPTRPNVA